MGHSSVNPLWRQQIPFHLKFKVKLPTNKVVFTDELIQKILQKVASDVNIEDIVSGKKRLSESDINVCQNLT